VQTVAAYSLRGYKVTFAPMLVHTVAFWGVGLFGGWWLAFRGLPAFGLAPAGVAGFWQASLASLAVAALAIGGILRQALARAGDGQKEAPKG
jgi:multidrug resistance protein, MATE family